MFALGIAMILKPFLTEYQLDKPLMFFLQDLKCLENAKCPAKGIRKNSPQIKVQGNIFTC